MHQLDLSAVIGSQNTLVISCVECAIVHPPDEGVFVYTCLASTLQDEDHTLAARIRYFIEEKACTQVIITGHLHCQALHYIRFSKSNESSISSLKSYLEDLEANNHIRYVRPEQRERYVAELNILRQTQLLMQYDFIEEKVSAGDLSVAGMIYREEDHSLQTIFFNGIPVNTLITMN